jgi:hypothetical protein
MVLVQEGIAVLILAGFFAIAHVPQAIGRKHETLGDKLRLLTRERLLAAPGPSWGWSSSWPAWGSGAC